MSVIHPFGSNDATHHVLAALGAQLSVRHADLDIVVVGGSALLALGLIRRATKDVDLLAIRSADGFSSADPLPPTLVEARDKVARDFALPPDWLNPGPAGLLRLGLPAGFHERVVVRHYGPALTVRFASRLDQIHLKLYAAVDASTPASMPPI